MHARRSGFCRSHRSPLLGGVARSAGVGNSGPVSEAVPLDPSKWQFHISFKALEILEADSFTVAASFSKPSEEI